MSVPDSPAGPVSERGAGAPTTMAGLLLCAGAVLAPQHGSTVALSYGSAAGELAACISAVGIASRSEMTKLELIAPARNLDHALQGLLERPLQPCGVMLSRAVGWFRIDDRRLIALCDPGHGERLRARLQFWTMRDPSLTMRDRSYEWGAIAVLGHRTDDVLSDLGVYGRGGDPRSVPPITQTGDDPSTTWLLCGEGYALALTPSAATAALWSRIAAAGRPWRMCAVGRDALVRYQMLAHSGH